MNLDYSTIKVKADLYDNGDKSHINYIAKMIWTAYEQGHSNGVLEVEQNFNQMNLLLFGDSGHA